MDSSTGGNTHCTREMVLAQRIEMRHLIVLDHSDLFVVVHAVTQLCPYSFP